MTSRIILKPIVTNQGDLQIRENLVTNFSLEFNICEPVRTWCEIVSILRNQQTDESFENQANIIKRTTRQNKYGFFLKDLPYILEAVYICYQRSHIFPLFLDAIFEIVHNCRLPFLMTSRGDALTYRASGVQLLEFLGCFLQSPDESLKVILCKSMREFYSGEHYKKKNNKENKNGNKKNKNGFNNNINNIDNLNNNNYNNSNKNKFDNNKHNNKDNNNNKNIKINNGFDMECNVGRTRKKDLNLDCGDDFIVEVDAKQTTDCYNRNLINSTNLAFVFSKYLTCCTPKDTVEFKLILLSFISLLATSEESCNLVLKADGIISTLCESFQVLRRNPGLKNRHLVSVSVHLLIDLVTHGEKIFLTSQLVSSSCINKLRDMCVHFVSQSFSHKDKQLRNDVATLISLIALNLTHVCSLNVLKTLTIFATFQEVKSHNVLVSRLRLNKKDANDFEFKLILLHTCSFLADLPGAVKVYEECHLIKALVTYIQEVTYSQTVYNNTDNDDNNDNNGDEYDNDDNDNYGDGSDVNDCGQVVEEDKTRVSGCSTWSDSSIEVANGNASINGNASVNNNANVCVHNSSKLNDDNNSNRDVNVYDVDDDTYDDVVDDVIDNDNEIRRGNDDVGIDKDGEGREEKVVECGAFVDSEDEESNNRATDTHTTQSTLFTNNHNTASEITRTNQNQSCTFSVTIPRNIVDGKRCISTEDTTGTTDLSGDTTLTTSKIFVGSAKISDSCLKPSCFWNKDQYRELQKTALRVLCRVGPMLLKDVVELNVVQLLLKFMSLTSAPVRRQDLRHLHCLRIDTTLSSTDSKQLLRLSTAALLNIISTKKPQLFHQAVSSHVFILFLDIIENCTLDADWLNEDVKMDDDLVVTLTDLVNLITVLCQDNTDYKMLLGRKGVFLVVKLLHPDLDLPQSSSLHLHLLLSTLHMIWTCIHGQDWLEELFVEMGGISSLLNLLKDSCQCIQSQILGLLSDLVNKSKQVSNITNDILSWRGNAFNDDEDDDEDDHVTNNNVSGFNEAQDKGLKKMSVYEMLCGLWRREETRLGVSRHHNGVVFDVQAPLKASINPPNTCPNNIDNTHLPSIVEINQNFRARIYAIFHKIGFPVSCMVHYRDALTMIIIENYLDLKACEVWKDMRERDKEYPPIHEDRQMVDDVSRTVDMKLRWVRDRQKQFLEKREESLLKEEELFYEKLKRVNKKNVF